MANISTEQALQIPQQLRRQNPQSGGGEGLPQGAENRTQGKNVLSDDWVTLQRLQRQQHDKRIDVKSYKSELGNDSAFVRETLKNKLSEYRLSPHTPLSVTKDPFGKIDVKGPVLQTELEKIKLDLENNPAFGEAFNRLSQQQPTLNYVDNVVKISQAYGVNNDLFDSLVSENEQFNGLNDIAHRYQAMRSNTAETGSFDDIESSRFSFVVN